MRRYLHILLITGFIGALTAATLKAQNDETVLPPSITVVGQGQAAAQPDMAELRIGVVTEADTAAQATPQNTRAMRQLMQMLERFEIAPRDMQTAQLSISPIHTRVRDEPPLITAYRVSNELNIRVRDLDVLGQLLDEAVQHEANVLRSVSFTMADTTAVQDESRRAAVRDARRKAELYAEAAEVRLGQVKFIHEIGAEPPRPLPAVQPRLLAEAEAVPVAPGEFEVQTQVIITYGILSD